MKKLFGGIAVAVVLLCGAMWVAGVAAHRAFDPRPWPANLGLLADAPAHFPDVETNPAAQALTELTPPLGFSITPKLPALQQPKVGNDWEAIKEPVNKYFHDELERTNEQIAPPPANVAAYLNDHRAQIDRARDHILNAGPIVWVTHFRMGADAPLPNLLGQMNLSKLLAARALMKANAGDATAWDDLHAIWLLDRELWQRPELISQLIALAGARMVNASAAKMPLPAPQWLAEIQSFDYRQHFAASHQAEAYFMTHEWRKEPGRFKALQSLYFEVAASSAAEKMRSRTKEMMETSNCDLSAVAPMQPDSWNFLEKMALPNFIPAWQRLYRFRAELEATRNALAIRSGQRPATASACADGTWAVTASSAVFSRELAVPSQSVKYPLAYRR